jgi:hypothetical protein
MGKYHQVQETNGFAAVFRGADKGKQESGRKWRGAPATLKLDRWTASMPIDPAR